MKRKLGERVARYSSRTEKGKNTNNIQDKSSGKKKIYIIIGVVILLLGGLYALKASRYTTHYFPNTKFNHIDVGNMTYDEAREKISNKNKHHILTIKIGDKLWKKVDISSVENKDESDKVLKQQLNQQHPFEWPVSYMKKTDVKVTPNTLNQTKVNQKVSVLKAALVNYNISAKPSVNATLKITEKGAEIQEGHKGTKIVVSEAIEGIKSAILHRDDSINLEKYYVKPAITKDSKVLKEDQEEVNKIAKIKAEYSLNDKKYRIPNKDILSWLYVDSNNQIAVNQQKLQKWLTQFASTHDVKDHAIPFKTTKEGTVKVNADVYSWSINVSAEGPKLAESILKAKNFTRIPVTNGSASAKGPLIGKNYVEVDLRNQYLYIYKNGKKVLGTDIVSGKPSSVTPTGLFYVWNKQQDAVLRGPGYASPVQYWMPIDWTGVGLHDADWQPAFGGQLWQQGYGSHGCVNIPPKVMPKVYKLVPLKTPVVIFK